MPSVTKVTSLDCGRGRPYGGVDPHHRREQRRRRLFDAAMTVIDATDRPPLTITGLCRDAGLATRSFYEEFGTVEHLLVSLHDELVDALVVELRRAARVAEGTIDERVRTVITAYVEWVAVDRRRARVFVAMIGVGVHAEAARRRALDRFAELLRELTVQWLGVAAALPSQSYGELFLVAGVQRAIEAWIDDPDPCAPDELVAQLEFVFLAVIHALPK